MTTLVETHYFPSVWVLAFLAAGDDLLYWEACETYQKGSWRQRCLIDGSNGVQTLTIPLRRGKHQQMPIREVRIAYDTPWHRSHPKTLASTYGNAPYFDHYADSLFRMFEAPPRWLWDWNLMVAEWLIHQLRLPGQRAYTREYRPALPEDTLDLRNALRPSSPADPPPGLRIVPYPQVFQDRHPFLPGLCGLDLLFCAGPSARDLLHAMRIGMPNGSGPESCLSTT